MPAKDISGSKRKRIKKPVRGINRCTLSYGNFQFPCRIEHDNLSISLLKKHGGAYNYKRTIGGEVVEKTLVTRKNEILISPIEPLFTPDAITNHLFIDLEGKLSIEPKEEISLYLKFPIELGVWVFSGKSSELLDYFSLDKQKFTLYGQPIGGLICKYRKSTIHTKKPKCESFVEGILKIKIKNKYTSWAEVTKVLLEQSGMDIFYSEKEAAMNAVMKIHSSKSAETDVKNKSPFKGWKRAKKVSSTKIRDKIGIGFYMEEGI